MTDGSKLVETFCRILPTPQPVRLETHMGRSAHQQRKVLQ